MGRMINEKQAANLMGISPTTLRTWRCLQRDRPPEHKFNRCIRYDREEVEEWMQSKKATVE